MNFRKLGATGLAVSEIGLGCNRLGEDDQPSAISCLIPGARTLEQLRDNAAASDAQGLPADIRQQIEQVRKQW